jgi:hypothetical protein
MNLEMVSIYFWILTERLFFSRIGGSVRWRNGAGTVFRELPDADAYPILRKYVI